MNRGIPRRLNMVLVAAFVAVGLGAFFGVPLLLARHPAWGLLLLVPVVLTTTNWALIHEGIHGALHPDRRVNELQARILGVLFGGAFQVLRFGHLHHHLFNRTALDRTEVFDPGRHHRLLFGIGYYLRLNAGLYVMELLGTLLFLLPRRLLATALGRFFPGDTADARKARQFARHHLLEPAALRAIRTDALVMLGVLAGAFLLYGEQGHLLLLMLLGRALVVSAVDNSFHYGTALDDVGYARNLRLPRPLERFILNFNLHRVHHRQAALSWHALPGAFTRQAERYDAGFAAAVARQYRGPIAVNALPRAEG